MIQVAKALWTTSVRYQSDSNMFDQCLVDVNPKVFAILGGLFYSKITYSNMSLVWNLIEMVNFMKLLFYDNATFYI